MLSLSSLSNSTGLKDFFLFFFFHKSNFIIWCTKYLNWVKPCSPRKKFRWGPFPKNDIFKRQTQQSEEKKFYYFCCSKTWCTNPLQFTYRNLIWPNFTKMLLWSFIPWFLFSPLLSLDENKIKISELFPFLLCDDKS